MNFFVIRSCLFFALLGILNRCNFVNPYFFKPSPKVLFYLTKKNLVQDKFFKGKKATKDGFYLRPTNPKISNFEANLVAKNAPNADFSAYFEG